METIVWVQSIASPWLDTLMTLITDLGSEEAYVALMLSFMLNQLAKGVFDTPRPFAIDPDVVRTERAQAGALGPGFPSGHAQSTATFWGVAALIIGPLLIEYRTDGRWLGRLWLTGLGLMVAFGIRNTTSLWLPEAIKRDSIGGFLRYFALTLAVTALTPWLAVRAGWTPGRRRR